MDVKDLARDALGLERAADLLAIRAGEMLADARALRALAETFPAIVMDVKMGPMQSIDCVYTPTPMAEVLRLFSSGARVLVQDVARWYEVEGAAADGKLDVREFESGQRRTILNPVADVIRVRYWVKSGA